MFDGAGRKVGVRDEIADKAGRCDKIPWDGGVPVRWVDDRGGRLAQPAINDVESGLRRDRRCEDPVMLRWGRNLRRRRDSPLMGSARQR